MKKGWERKRLGEVCEITMGQSPDGDTYNTTGEGVPLINGPVEFSNGPFGRTVRSKFTTQPTKFCKEGDLVLCVRGSTTGRMNIAGFDACIGRGVAAIRAKEYQPWINHFISAKRDAIHQKGTGATFPNVSGAALADLSIPVPPLSEQRRIVGILDEAFAGIATAKANAETNLRNARAVFESHLNAVFSKKGEGWVERRLGEATSGVFTGPFGSLLHKRDYVENGIPLVNPAHITETGINPDLSKTVSKQTAKRLASYIMHQGDIVIGRRGEMGRCALVTEIEDGWLCGTGSFFIKHSSRCDPRFIVRYLRSDGCRRRLEELAGGAVMPNLSNTALASFVVALPPLAEQKQIVAQLDSLSSQTQRLASVYERKVAALEALKKSLLHQAFSGGL